ncbi:MAG: Maf family protein [Alphaproteobacteria bacterium]|nr:Maf family protein [Alphaproteobacteria bacterium]MDA8009634.1 Maf family protein [Alphaproteobacteria bacterium]
MYPSVVLASRSVARRRLLEGAGVVLSACEDAALDEDELLRGFADEARGAETSESAAAAAAMTLAEMKALRVSARCPGVFVVGGDQIVVRRRGDEREWLGKPRDLGEAREQLCGHSGTTSVLVTAAVVARDGERVWGVVERPRAEFRRFSGAEADAVLGLQGEETLLAAGSCLFEGAGLGLVSRLEGDFFSLLGLPLLGLLSFLREQPPS